MHGDSKQESEMKKAPQPRSFHPFHEPARAAVIGKIAACPCSPALPAPDLSASRENQSLVFTLSKTRPVSD